MATVPKIPADTSIDQFLETIMPDVAAQMLAAGTAGSELAGTVINMVLEVGPRTYTYEVKDGSSMSVSASDLPGAMLRLKISEADLGRMIATENLDLILGIQNDLNRAKYNALKSLKGSFVAEIADEANGAVYTIEATLNNTRDPRSLFRMNAKDSSALMRRETNPVNLFMSGAMKIEGDMAFAMATQPLFS